MSNYRPISILATFSKILEKVFYKRLLNYLNKYEISCNNQYGFRKRHSTSLGVVDLYHKVTFSWIEAQFMELKYLPSSALSLARRSRLITIFFLIPLRSLIFVEITMVLWSRDQKEETLVMNCNLRVNLSNTSPTWHCSLLEL